MVPPTSVVLGPPQRLLEYFQRDRHHHDAQKDEAIAALQEAIIQTLEYLEASDGEKCFDRDVEFQLSRRWNEAARRIRHVSRGLSERLQEKAFYWADQLDWSANEVAAKRIELTGICDELRRLVSS